MKELKYQITELVKNNEIQIRHLEYEDSEIEDLDLSLFAVEEKARFDLFGSKKRKLEFYFTRVLLKTVKVDTTIVYTSTGKPIINEGHISISHAKNSIIIGYSEKYIIGVDIEYFSKKIERIQDKFLSQAEKDCFDISNPQVLTILWSIKEAVYKMEDIPGLTFKEQILVKQIEPTGSVEVLKNNLFHHYYFHYLLYPDFIITYCQLDNK